MLGDQALGRTKAIAVGWSRWGICALLFFATTLNYIDRQIIGILKPELARQLGWNEIDYSNVVFAFQVAYAIGYAGAGRLIDRLGVRLGLHPGRPVLESGGHGPRPRSIRPA
jgi:ACS family hexuronate transporter-like MFS transporter